MAAEVKIMEALFIHAASIPVGLPVSYPNLSFDPPNDQKYLKVQFIPNLVNRLFVGSDDPHQDLGLLQISVKWPKNVGEVAPRDVAAKVADHFAADTQLTFEGVTVKVLKRPTLSDLIVEAAGVQIAVTIDWECII